MSDLREILSIQDKIPQHGVVFLQQCGECGCSFRAQTGRLTFSFSATRLRPEMAGTEAPDWPLHNRPVLILWACCIILCLASCSRILQISGTARPFGSLNVECNLLDRLGSTGRLQDSQLSTWHSYPPLDSTHLITHHPMGSQTVSPSIIHGQFTMFIIYSFLCQASARVFLGKSSRTRLMILTSV